MNAAGAMLPPATLGLLGGGQLGRFFVGAAHELGYRVLVLDPDPHSPAGQIADEHLIAGYSDPDALDRMAQTCAAVTTEFENVPADTLAYLSKFVPVRPSAEAVALCQNRSAEKGFLRQHGFPHAPYADIKCEADLTSADESLFPGILKIARFGYDGKGQARVASRAEALVALQRFKGEACVLETMLSLESEVSVVLARTADGAVTCFPVAENRHREGILDISIVPARATAALADEARAIATRIATQMNYVGVLAVEFFIVDRQLRVNEMAPRPHNSGHYTLDACIASQYEQQVRALTGLPLAAATAHSASVMVNLLGDLWFRDNTQLSAHHSKEPDWSPLLATPNLKLHFYGKHHARQGRKMGHFTLIDSNLDRACQQAQGLRNALGLPNE
jgi:5-(carboxyamino)imidazole ribonucleotide synthase